MINFSKTSLSFLSPDPNALILQDNQESSKTLSLHGLMEVKCMVLTMKQTARSDHSQMGNSKPVEMQENNYFLCLVNSLELAMLEL